MIRKPCVASVALCSKKTENEILITLYDDTLSVSDITLELININKKIHTYTLYSALSVYFNILRWQLSNYSLWQCPEEIIAVDKEFIDKFNQHISMYNGFTIKLIKDFGFEEILLENLMDKIESDEALAIYKTA